MHCASAQRSGRYLSAVNSDSNTLLTHNKHIPILLKLGTPVGT